MESPEHESRSSIPPGRRFRLAGPKALLNDIKNQEGGMIEVTGLIRKGQLDQSGVSLGGGVRPAGALAPRRRGQQPNFNQIVLDVEGWRALAGTRPGR